MDGIIHARHPVPVRYVPRGGFRERIGFAPATTPVRLRQVDPGALRRVARLGADIDWVPRDFYEMDGALWSPVREVAPKEARTGPLVTHYPIPDFVDFLATGHGAHGYAAHAFHRTPLFGIEGKDSLAVSAGVIPASLRAPPDAAGHVVEDLSARARDDVRAFLEERVVLADLQVFVRVDPVYGREAGKGTYRVEVFPPARAAGRLYARLDRAEEFWAFERPYLGHQFQGDPCRKSPLEIAPALLGDADVLLYANAAPRMVLLPSERRPAVLDATPADRLDALRHWRALGAISSITLAEAGEALRLAQEQAWHLLHSAIEDMTRQETDGLLMLVRYVRDVALPRLAEAGPEPTADDADALAGLGPGGL